MGIRVPDEDFIKEAIDQAEDTLLRRAGYCFLLEVENVDEAGFSLAATRNDGARARFDAVVPAEVAHEKLSAFERVRRDRQWFKGELNAIVENLCKGLVKDEDEPAPQAETEQRFETVVIFTSRPDIVLTPPGGVLADEATRVYRTFRDGAAAIGGRCFTAPVEA